MRETFCLARSLSTVHIILPEVVNVIVVIIFVWLVQYRICVYRTDYRVPYGFTLQYTVSLRPSGLSPSLGLPSALVAP